MILDFEQARSARGDHESKTTHEATDLENRQPGIVQDGREVCQELRALLPVDDAMVKRDRQLSHPPRHDLLVDDPGHPAYGAEGNDA